MRGTLSGRALLGMIGQPLVACRHTDHQASTIGVAHLVGRSKSICSEQPEAQRFVRLHLLPLTSPNAFKDGAVPRQTP
jgi:hypothetical protein